MRWLDAVLSTTARAGAANSMAAPAAAGYAGVSDKCFWAAMLFYAGESSYAPLLRLPLLEAAIKLRKRNKWPRLFAKEPWTDKLTSLALAEYTNPAIAKLNGWWWRHDERRGGQFTAYNTGDCIYRDGWWSFCIDCPPDAWVRVISPRYESVRAILDGWRDTAKRQIALQLPSYMAEEEYLWKTYKQTTEWGEEGRRMTDITRDDS